MSVVLAHQNVALGFGSVGAMKRQKLFKKCGVFFFGPFATFAKMQRHGNVAVGGHGQNVETQKGELDSFCVLICCVQRTDDKMIVQACNGKATENIKFPQMAFQSNPSQSKLWVLLFSQI